MITITTVEEVQKTLQLKNINLDDEKVEGLIEYYTNKIIGITGIDLNVQTYHYSIENKTMVQKIVLPLYNIFDVDEVHVDWKLLPDTKYFTDTKNGVVFFKPTIPSARHIHIKYLTRLDDQIVQNIIAPLLTDMIIDGEDPDTMGITGDITSIHEGGVSISLSNSTSLKQSIQNRLDKLANGEITSVSGKNRKGAYYI